MKSLLSLFVLLLTPVAFAASATTLDLGQATDLQECGGSIEATVSRNGNEDQVNLVLRNVQNCSNFIVLQTNKEYKIPGENYDRNGSFTIPASSIDLGSSTLVLTVRSNSGIHNDKIFIPVVRTVTPPAPSPVTCFGGLCVGDAVINIERSYASATVVAIQNDGNYVIRYLSGDNYGKTGGNWTRASLAKKAGCSKDLCVGSTVINTGSNSDTVKVVGIQTNGNYVVMFLSGDNYGKVGGNWTRDDLALTSGCGYDFCVGDMVYVAARNYEQAKVVGIQKNGNYVIMFLSGDNYGKSGAGWSRDDLSLISR